MIVAGFFFPVSGLFAFLQSFTCLFAWKKFRCQRLSNGITIHWLISCTSRFEWNTLPTYGCPIRETDLPSSILFANKGRLATLFFYLFIYLFIYSRYKKAVRQPKAEKHRFYKQNHKYMKNKLFTNIQAIENTWKAKYIQKLSTSYKQINLKIIIEHMNYIRHGWILKPVGFAPWRWKPIAPS